MRTDTCARLGVIGFAFHRTGRRSSQGQGKHSLLKMTKHAVQSTSCRARSSFICDSRLPFAPVARPRPRPYVQLRPPAGRVRCAAHESICHKPTERLPPQRVVHTAVSARAARKSDGRPCGAAVNARAARNSDGRPCGVRAARLHQFRRRTPAGNSAAHLEPDRQHRRRASHGSPDPQRDYGAMHPQRDYGAMRPHSFQRPGFYEVRVLRGFFSVRRL